MIERLGDLSGSIAQELHACQLELITDVHLTVGEAIGSLASMRRSVGEIGAGLLGSGTHPSGLEGDAEITDKERYERIRFLLGGRDDQGHAGRRGCMCTSECRTRRPQSRAFNALREQLPLLQALAANSPFRHGRDTGLQASAREISIRGWPRSGVAAARTAGLRRFLRALGAVGHRRRRRGLHLVLVEAAPASAAGHRRGAGAWTRRDRCRTQARSSR